MLVALRDHSALGRDLAVLLVVMLVGGLIGLAYAADIVVTLQTLWHDVVAPAYLDLFLNGFPFCG